MKRKWIYIGSSALVLAIPLLISNRRSISEAIKSGRANQHIENAQLAKASGEDSEALRLALAAYELDPGNLDALRVLLSTRAGNSSSQLIQIANTIFRNPEADAEDRSRCLGLYLEARDFRLFRTQYGSLPDQEKQLPDNLYLFAGYFAGQGLGDAALSVLDQGPDNDPRFHLLSASLRALSTDKKIRRSAQESLAQQISSTDTDLATRALRKIRNIPLNYIEVDILMPAANRWMKIRGNSKPAFPDLLAVKTLQYLDAGGEANPAAFVIIKETISEMGSSYPVAIGTWLNYLNLGDAAYDFAKQAESETGEDDMATRQALFEIKLRALELTKRWEEQLTRLNSPPDGISPLRLALLRANAAERLERKSEAEQHWQEAWRYSELDSLRRNSYLDIYRAARRSNNIDQATRALIAATQTEIGMLPPTNELSDFMSYLAENDRGEELTTLANALIRRETFSAPLINNAVYLTEVTGQQIPGAEVLIQQLSERNPTILGMRTTLILLFANRDQIPQAFSVAEEVVEKVDVAKLPPTESVILAGAYRLSGKRLEAAEQNLDEKLDSLMAVERRRYAPWFEE